MNKAPTIDAAIDPRWAKERLGNRLTDAAYRRGYVAGQAGEPFTNPYHGWPLHNAVRAWRSGYRDGSLRRLIGVKA